MSYYIEDLVEILMADPNNDYFEMILHHLLAIFLIIGSYMCGYWPFGSFVLVQMDVCDIFVGLIRATMDFSSAAVTFIVWCSIFLSFIYFRVFAYFKCVIIPLTGILSIVDNAAPVTPMCLPPLIGLF